VKTFYSAQEIEDLARQGVRELVVDDSVVLTDLARQMAGQLGLRLVAARSAAPVVAQAPAQGPARPAANGAAQPAHAVAAAAPLPAKPKGCQHGSTPAVANGRAALGTPAGNSSAGGGVMDDLVGLVKQMSKR
jgi:hypothetical protein